MYACMSQEYRDYDEDDGDEAQPIVEESRRTDRKAAEQDAVLLRMFSKRTWVEEVK